MPKSRCYLFATIALVGCAVDLFTKSWIFARLRYPTTEPIWILPGLFSLDTSLNEGALFGMASEHTLFGLRLGWAFFFAGISLLAAIGIVVWLFVFKAARELWLTVAMACVMAGILGNLYDRLGFPGLAWPPNSRGHLPGEPVYAVRDWLHSQYQSYHWPVFNIADMLLVCGAGMLAIQSFRKEPKSAIESSNQTAASH